MWLAQGRASVLKLCSGLSLSTMSSTKDELQGCRPNEWNLESPGFVSKILLFKDFLDNKAQSLNKYKWGKGRVY